MSKTAPAETVATAPLLASSAVVIGTPQLGDGALLSEGAVIRARASAVQIGTGSAVIENAVVIGTPAAPVVIGRRTTFGHRCLVVGATVGDLCEIGNASILMPGAVLGDRVFLGEGTLVPTGMVLPDDVVAVGRPAHVIRTASEADLERLRGLRAGDLSLPPHTVNAIGPRLEGLAMGQLYDYRGILPTIADTAVLFPTAEITGDVVIGERTIIGAGVKIIGDSHGPVRIGNDVQILENTVLHLLPDNELIIDDGTTVGPGAMIHGCRIGAGTVVEPGAIVCDGAVVGAGCVVRAGAVVKQRSQFGDAVEIDGFPATEIGRVESLARPAWALDIDDLPVSISRRSCPMTTRRHVAHAVAATGATAPQWRVDLRTGAHQLVADEPATNGGGDAGPSPFGLLLSGLAACTAMTLRMYAEHKSWTLAAIEVDVRYNVDDNDEASIERTITLPADLPTEQRDRLADIAERTPVTLAVRRGTPITTVIKPAT